MRRDRGLRNCLAGQAAETLVERDYLDRGYALAARRWRGRAGEIDLVFRDRAGLVFVEVKRGSDFDRALSHLGARQIGRLCRAAEEFAAAEPAGALTDIRLDIGLVDGHGAVRVIENALAA